MDTASSMRDRVCEHTLQFARAKGWSVQASDCAVTHIPQPPGVRSTNPVIYWEVKLKIRASLNRRRALTRDGQITGMVRISGDSLLDNLAESSDTLRARLMAEGDL